MPEAPGRFIDAEPFRGPAAGSWKLLYTVPSYPSEAHVMLSVHVCNGKGADAHISLWIIPETDGSGWTDHLSSAVRTNSSVRPTDQSTLAVDGMPAAVTGG